MRRADLANDRSPRRPARAQWRVRACRPVHATVLGVGSVDGDNREPTVVTDASESKVVAKNMPGGDVQGWKGVAAGRLFIVLEKDLVGIDRDH